MKAIITGLTALGSILGMLCMYQAHSIVRGVAALSLNNVTMLQYEATGIVVLLSVVSALVHYNWNSTPVVLTPETESVEQIIDRLKAKAIKNALDKAHEAMGGTP